MKIHHREPKIYRDRSRRNRRMFTRHRRSTAASVLGTVALVGGLVVIGYCIAGPLFDHFSKEEPAATTPDSSAAPTQRSLDSSDDTADGSDIAATTTAPAETETTIATTTTTAGISVNGQDFTAHFLDVEALDSLTALNHSLADIPAGESVVLPLKVEGGALRYASTLEKAAACGAVQGELTLETISDALAAHALTAIAEVSLLSDNLYPAYDYDANYFFGDGSGRWLDNTPEKDGKPWLSPFSDNAVAYLDDITDELTANGFHFVLCKDVAFPPFYDTDLDHIGELVKSTESRRKALSGLLNRLQKTAQENGGSVMLAFSLYDALNRDVEALEPILLDVPNAMVTIDMNSFRSSFWHDNERLCLSGKSVTEILGTILPIAENLTGEMAVVPCLREASLSAAERTEAADALRAMGYTRICFK